MAIRVLIADDYEPFRKGLRNILEDSNEIVVVAEAACTGEAEELAARLQPDVAILDVQMPKPNGIAAIRPILESSPQTAVMMLSIHGDKHYVTRSAAAGARGYVLKDSPEDTIVAAVRTLAAGNTCFIDE